MRSIPEDLSGDSYEDFEPLLAEGPDPEPYTPDEVTALHQFWKRMAGFVSSKRASAYWTQEEQEADIRYQMDDEGGLI